MYTLEVCRVEVDDNLSFIVRVSVNEDGETADSYDIGTISYGDHTYNRRNVPDDILARIQDKMQNISDEELMDCISQY